MPVVTLDAFDTLITLEPPVPRLVAALAGIGHPQTSGRVAQAFMAEVDYYLDNHLRGADPESLADLRADCAQVFADALDDPPSVDVLGEILIGALRFRLFDDVPEALDGLAARGARLAVVSNWDSSLTEILTALGIAGRFEVIISSAAAGAAKPSAAPFLAALDQMGVTPSAEILHCGDSPEADGDGARAAGLSPVIIDREGAGGDDPHPRIRRLTELAGRLS